MIIEPLALPGPCLIKPEPHEDQRGFFARTFCKREFKRHGLVDDYVQSSISFNTKKGTLRGLHYQIFPHEETKLIRCTRGALFDVIVDIRLGSRTRGKWIAVELDQQNRFTLYIPAGFAHGFYTLVDNTEVMYHMDRYFEPTAARTMNYRHELLNIPWPAEPKVLSDKDRLASDDPLGATMI